MAGLYVKVATKKQIIMDLKNQTQKRTIKFRAFDDGKMIYENNILHLNNEDNLVLRLAKFWCNIRNDSHVMQFTGLYDKNGKEIYEGDILKTFPIISSDKTSYDSFNVVVKFTSSSWIANGVLGFRQAEISEVIGNIYENPELLTD